MYEKDKDVSKMTKTKEKRWKCMKTNENVRKRTNMCKNERKRMKA